MDIKSLIEEATTSYVVFYQRIFADFALDLYFLYGEKPNISQLALPFEQLHNTPIYIEDSHTLLPYCIIGLTAELSGRRISICEQVLYNFYDKAVHKTASVVVRQTATQQYATVFAPEKTEEERQQLEKKFMEVVSGLAPI